jgi:hypothetical protein
MLLFAIAKYVCIVASATDNTKYAYGLNRKLYATSAQKFHSQKIFIYSVMSYARKYKFWDWVSALPRQQRSQQLNALAAAVGTSRRTLNTWLDAEAGSTLQVSFESVVAISRSLGHDPLTALNTPVAIAQPA